MAKKTEAQATVIRHVYSPRRVAKELAEELGVPKELALQVARIDPDGQYGSQDSEGLLGIPAAYLRNLKSDKSLEPIEGLKGPRNSSVYSGEAWIAFLLKRASLDKSTKKVVTVLRQARVTPVQATEPGVDPSAHSAADIVPSGSRETVSGEPTLLGSYPPEFAQKLLGLSATQLKSCIDRGLLVEAGGGFAWDDLVSFASKLNARPLWGYWGWFERPTGVSDGHDDELWEQTRCFVGWSLDNDPITALIGTIKGGRDQALLTGTGENQSLRAVLYGFVFRGGPLKPPSRYEHYKDDGYPAYRHSLWLDVQASKSGTSG